MATTVSWLAGCRREVYCRARLQWAGFWRHAVGPGLCLALALGPCRVAWAYGGHGDRAAGLFGDILIETQGNWTPHSEDPAHETLDLYTTVEAGASLVLTPAWSLSSTVVVEPVEDPAPFHNRLFGGNGAFIEQLYVTYDVSSWAVFAGKFNPAFAIAWDIAPGLYGPDIAEDYELTERIGLGVRLTGADGRGGGLQLSAALFNVDTTALSSSLLVNRDRTHRHRRAPGNAGALSSWSLALTSHHPAGITGLTLHAALSHQAAREGPAQNGRALAAHYAFALGERLAASVLVEWVHFTGFEGRRTADGAPARAIMSPRRWS